MKIYQTLQIGDYHTNHCEDYLFCGEIGNDKIICAVMDGCTMAIDSYFASTLVGKLLRKITIERSYKEFYKLEPKFDNIDSYLKSILKQLIDELIITRNQLMLDTKELLTTLIILVLDKTSNKGIVLVIGDGFVNINGKFTEFDQDNKPDYLGFHLGKNIDSWYDSQIQKIIFDDIQDISIATDGIFTFSKMKHTETIDEINVLDYLLVDNSNTENIDMLNFKLKQLENKFGLKPTDDLAIIRIKKL